MSDAGPTAVFARTADGHLAARVDDLAYLAVPRGDGFGVACAWRRSHPIEQWKSADFHGASAIVPDEAGFRDHVEEIAQHKRDVAALGRRRGTTRARTPWGPSQLSEVYADGIVFHSTASHGGFRVSKAQAATMPEALRVEGGWFEEDEAWAMVAAAFPHLFTAYERRHADRTLKNGYPDAWEAVYGRPLEPGESFVRDRQRFEAEHANDWIVISACSSEDHPEMYCCSATRGGKRNWDAARDFLVPKADYHYAKFGFVIDEQRHVAL